MEECSSAPCLNDGACIDDVNKYMCNCLAGYNGDHCETSKLSL